MKILGLRPKSIHASMRKEAWHAAFEKTRYERIGRKRENGGEEKAGNERKREARGTLRGTRRERGKKGESGKKFPKIGVK